MAPEQHVATAARIGASLAAEQVEKWYGGIQALAGVDLEVDAGEIHGLLGENGAGKSTLLRIVTAVERADSGTIYVDQAPLTATNIRETRALGIHMIFQHQHVVPELTVAANICLGEETRRWGVLQPAEDKERARRALERLDLDIAPGTPVAELSFAERQMIEIAKALQEQSRVLILDEPTAALGRDETTRLFALLRQLQSRYGSTIIYVSHRLEEIVDICDRVTVLRDGRVVAKKTLTKTTNARDLANLIVAEKGQAMDSAPQQHTKVATEAQGEILRARRLTSDNGLLRADFDLRRGEILGLFGLVGSGRSELLRAIVGADPLTEGTIELEGEAVRFKSPANAAAAGIGLVPEDRQGDGIFGERNVALNILSASIGRYSEASFVRARAARAAAAAVSDRLAIKMQSLGAPIATLSGGNQQKAVLARWLVAKAKVLLFDEPTMGVDVGAKTEIYRVIDDLCAQGMAVVVASSDIDEITEISDRVLVMRGGVTVGTVEKQDIGEDLLFRLALGEEVAHAVP